jgi:hypothetical protein
VRLQGEELISGLGRLERASRALALTDEGRCLRAVGIEVAHDGRLDPHGILKAVDGVLPTSLRGGNELLARCRQRHLAVIGLERLIDPLNVVGNALGLGEKLLRPCDRLLKLL